MPSTRPTYPNRPLCGKCHDIRVGTKQGNLFAARVSKGPKSQKTFGHCRGVLLIARSDGDGSLFAHGQASAFAPTAIVLLHTLVAMHDSNTRDTDLTRSHVIKLSEISLLRSYHVIEPRL